MEPPVVASEDRQRLDPQRGAGRQEGSLAQATPRQDLTRRRGDQGQGWGAERVRPREPGQERGRPIGVSPESPTESRTSPTAVTCHSKERALRVLFQGDLLCPEGGGPHTWASGPPDFLDVFLAGDNPQGP